MSSAYSLTTTRSFGGSEWENAGLWGILDRFEWDLCQNIDALACIDGIPMTARIGLIVNLLADKSVPPCACDCQSFVHSLFRINTTFRRGISSV